MGPAATVDLFNLIVKNTQASCDQEHIHILIDNNTEIPDRTAAIISGSESPVNKLCSSAKLLYNAGADFLIIPCNTSHYYIQEIRKKVPIPIVDMIEETAKSVKGDGYNKAIILCTEGTRKTGVYTDRFIKQGIDVIYPDSDLQDQVDRIIYDGIKNGNDYFDISEFNLLLNQLEMKTAAVTILGCTELPIAREKYGMCGNFINPTLILAKTSIRLAGYSII